MTDAPAPFARQLEARLRAPSMLDPRAVPSVLAHAFDAISDDGTAGYFGDAEGAYTVDDQGVAVVSVDGALAQRAWSCWMFGGDGYDAIESRVRAALTDERSRALVLRIDSPGGEVAGCGVCAQAIRSLADASGKPVVAYCDELAASAAYWLASAADKIVTPPSGILGSIGVISARVEEMDAGSGRKVHLITSGARKADGHPLTAMSEDELAATQAKINALADVFAGAVAERRGMTLAQVRGLEADVFVGADAVARGLADTVADFSEAIALAASLADHSTPTNGQQTMKTLLTAMGLQASASEAEAVAKYNEATAAQAANATQITRLLGLCGAQTADEAAATIAALKADAAQAKDLRAQVEQARLEQIQRERATVLDKAVSDGVMSPAERAEYDNNPALATVPAESIRASIKHRAPLVPGRRVDLAPVKGALSEDERAIARATGISPEAFIARRDAQEGR